MLGRCSESSKYYFALLIAVLSILLTSCGARKELYDNQYDTKILSQKLKVPIERNDPDMVLYREVAGWLGTPYKYGGVSKKGTDCSGFVWLIFEKVYSKALERSSKDQAAKDVNKVSKKNLKTGDLVFFSTGKKKKSINHVGIYLKNDYFIHASTSSGVIVSNLDDAYYKRTWKMGGRIK